jgi:hypothetical protein
MFNVNLTQFNSFPLNALRLLMPSVGILVYSVESIFRQTICKINCANNDYCKFVVLKLLFPFCYIFSRVFFLVCQFLFLIYT